jgi:kynureninase
MELNFKGIAGAQGYRLSNPSVLATIALLGSTTVFDKTNMNDLCKKSRDLTGYLEYLILKWIPSNRVVIITPSDPNQRGCQLSLLFLVPREMMKVFHLLSEAGIVCDERKPDVIRVAPTPLYNTFSDVWNFVSTLCQTLQ